MTKGLRTTVAVAVVSMTALAFVVSPASAGTLQLSGIGTPAAECDGIVSDFTIEMTGSLVGCWYTTITDSKFNPSGTYQERGTETFVGCVNGTMCGSFSTTYTFTAKYVDDTFAEEIHGRCHHAIVSGTGDLAGATGMVNMKDDVAAGIFIYEGHIT